MKKIFFALSCVLSMSLFSYAETVTAQISVTPQEASVNNWTFIRLQLLPSFPEPSSHYTYGLVLGLPSSGGASAVDGVEAALVSASTDYVRGVQGAFIVNAAKKVSGLQGSIVNVVSEKAVGLQAGATNVSTGNVDGVQFSLVNSVSDTLKGSQIGAVNYAEKADGFQIGIFNVAEKSAYQIGLINYIDDNWLQFCFIFNGSLFK